MSWQIASSLIAAVLLGQPGAAGAAASCTGPPEKLLVMRHACKCDDGDSDSPLSPVGRWQADCLASALAKETIDMVIVTVKQRTQQTVEPLASSKGVAPAPPIAHSKSAARDFAAEVCAGSYKGRTVLFVGHSDTLPTLYKELGRLYGAPRLGRTTDHGMGEVRAVTFKEAVPERPEALATGCGRPRTLDRCKDRARRENLRTRC